MPRQVRDSVNPEEASDVKVIVARKASVCDDDVESDVRVELIMDLKSMSANGLSCTYISPELWAVGYVDLFDP